MQAWTRRKRFQTFDPPRRVSHWVPLPHLPSHGAWSVAPKCVSVLDAVGHAPACATGWRGRNAGLSTQFAQCVFNAAAAPAAKNEGDSVRRGKSRAW